MSKYLTSNTRWFLKDPPSFSNALPANADLTEESLEQLCVLLASLPPGPSRVSPPWPEDIIDAHALTDTLAGDSPTKPPTTTGSSDTCYHGREVVGIWMRRLRYNPPGMASAPNWVIIVAWSNPGADWYHNPEYGILADDGSLIAPLWSDWAFQLVHGCSRYETKRYDLGTDWRAIYGTAGE